MPVKLGFLIFFSIILLNFFPKNNLVFAHILSDTTCTCSANQWCSVATTPQSHCHPYGDDRWVWEGCHFDANSCFCRPNGCGGAPVPTATPIVVPTATPAIACPVNVSCCYSPLTRCIVNGQCPVGYQWCYAGICVKENYNPGTNTCSAPTATPTLRPTLPPATPTAMATSTPTLPPGSSCRVTGVSASDGQYSDRIYISWTVANGDEAQRIDLYQGNTYLTSQSSIDTGQWHFNHQNLTCPVVNNYLVYCWKDGRLYGQSTDSGSTLCPTPTRTPPTGGPTSTPRISLTPTPTSRWPTATPPVAYGAWFQSQDGDVHAQGKINDPMSPIPPKIFSLNGEGGFPGVISFRGTRAQFGSGAISSKEWLAQTGFVLRNFHFYDAFLRSPQTNNFNGVMPSGDGVYFAGSDQIITSDWNLSGGERIIILIDGNVRILGNIVVPYGSSLVLITSGSINFGNDVSQAQGIFLADKKIVTGTGPVAFGGEGSFVAGQEIILGRNFGDTRNRFTPVEKFIFRPDLLINSLSDIWSFGHVWEELAP